MPRLLKPLKVDEYRSNKKGVIVEIFLDRNDKHFFGKYAGQVISRPSEEEVKRAIHEFVEMTVELKWIPMITVSRLKPFGRHDGPFVGFDISRSLIAQKPDKRWMQLRWDDEGKEQNATTFYPGVKNWETMTLPASYEDMNRDSDFYYLPYTDALWAGLEAIIEKIVALRERLNELLTTPEGLKAVERQAGKLLEWKESK